MAVRHSSQVCGRPRMTGGAQQVAAIEEQARVDVPRQAEQAAGAIDRRHDIGVEDAGEVVVARDAGAGHPLVERLQRAEGAELGQPGVAELAEVGQGVAGEGGQKLLVRRRPGQLLHPNLHARVALAKGREQLDDHFGFAPHGPEIERALGVGPAAAAAGERAGDQRHRAPADLSDRPAAPVAAGRRAGPGHHASWSSQPPVNPARARPRRSGAQLRMSSQTSWLR